MFRRLTVMMQGRILAMLLLIALAAGWSTHASAIEPVSYPAPPRTPVITVINGDRRVELDLAQIEALGLYRITTTSPWELGTFTYEGVLMRDVMRKIGLFDRPSIRVRASNNYTQVIPHADWADMPLLLATRQDGKLLTRREQGPTRLVYPILDQPELDTEAHKRSWIWLVESIETVD